jgi:hypothetical protein
MFASAMVLFSLLQFTNHNSRASDHLPPEMLLPAETQHVDTDRRLAAYREQQFAGSMNRFVDKLRDFVQQYNKDRGINVKKIKALKKAWRDVEQTEPWLRTLPRE